MVKRPEPATLFLLYAHEDERLLEQFVKHLSLLQRQRLISIWHDRQVQAGVDLAKAIDAQLAAAAVILLLVSPDFLASDYCMTQMQHVLDRQDRVRVIPIILRPVDWQSAAFAHLSYLPRDAHPVTSWQNQDEAFQSIVQGIRELIEPSTSLSSPHSSTTRHTHLPHERRYRQSLLNRMHKIWIEGVLQNQLDESSLITLELSEQPDALYDPLQDIVQEATQSAHPLPQGTHISSVYDHANGELLILGKPGSGKTILLLELARVLLERSRRDENHLLPIVLNLSEWSRHRKQQSLADWIGEELYTKYKIPRNIGRAWIAQDQLLLLLDGLDEVSPKLRGPCLAAINDYQDQHSLSSIVVCCRQQDYEELTQKQHKLRLQCAVSIRPLTDKQIDAYLQRSGASLHALKTTLQTSTQQLAETPLMLSILARTYQVDPAQDASQPASSAVQQERLFETYIGRMLQRRGRDSRYTEQQTRRYLAFLARNMNLEGQTEFYIEQMQPDWLHPVGLYPLYRFIMNRSLEVLGFLCITLFFALFAGMISVTSLPPKPTSISIITLFLQLLLTGLLSTCFFLIVIGVLAIFICIFTGNIYAILAGIARWWVGIFDLLDEIQLVETIIWPWELFRPRVVPLILGGCLFLSLIMGGLFGLVSGTTVGPNELYTQQCNRLGGRTDYPQNPSSASGTATPECEAPPHASDQLVNKIMSIPRELFDVPAMENGFISGFIVALLLDPLIGLSFFLFTQVTWRVRNRSTMVKPNQGFWLTIFNSIFVGFVGWFAFSLIYGLGGGFVIGHFSDTDTIVLVTAIIACFGASIFSLIVWLRFGGLACIQYLILRLLFLHGHYVPWWYAHFLDYASERLLLRKVGGGYMFLHHLLQDHFAA